MRTIGQVPPLQVRATNAGADQVGVLIDNRRLLRDAGVCEQQQRLSRRIAARQLLHRRDRRLLLQPPTG
jgi:hypothetical protein